MEDVAPQTTCMTGNVPVRLLATASMDEKIIPAASVNRMPPSMEVDAVWLGMSILREVASDPSHKACLP